ncbi:Teichoic-acid-transporting ATPase [Cycloclasticus zancles 78-ME]|uniref:Teichoic-acid-transporting ATPase n=1 Tax=Cycloclasticus zancles 78-ME TaxID=1198232 RepID=S5TDE2_9GAMM|nr:Teichoic-acid-transporting ATPase [Cycloclasticus zancles 78-ME]
MYNSEPIISLKNVGVSYRRRAGVLRWNKYWALNDITFDLYKGETLGIIGRNGAGKSTLLQVLAGIISPDKGVITHNESTVSLLSLQVGFLPHITGRENAILSGMLLGINKSEIEKAMPKIIEFSGLGEFIDQPVNSYSTGMRARLGFSVANQMDPDVILVDEVLGVGDVEFKKKSAAAMREKISSNKTVVIVSHDEKTLKDLCDRILWVDRKGMCVEGGIDDVLISYNQSY